MPAAFLAFCKQPAADFCSRKLDNFYQDEDDDDGCRHNAGAEALVPVADGKVAQSAAANRSGHCGIADKVDDGKRNAVNQRRHCFWYEHL